MTDVVRLVGVEQQVPAVRAGEAGQIVLLVALVTGLDLPAGEWCSARLDAAGVVHVPLPVQAALDAASRRGLPP